MNDMRATISKNIRDFRKAAGYSQAEIARRLGKAVTSVSSWEQGKSLPSADTLYELCSILGISINEVYGESPADRWIESSKRLPKTRGIYQATAKEPTKDARIIVLYVGWDGEKWLNLDESEFPLEVVAWKPLPKAYKE